jgi:NADH-quinone oxidoreductase subunit G
MDAESVTITVDGRTCTVSRRHTNLISALREAGVTLPYFCYHDGLGPDGNCRICFVNIDDPRTGEISPKLVTACTTPPRNGMKVATDTPAVRAGREAVMEFELVHHPLDCPVCDKAGECVLQDYSYAHGRDRSRAADPKNVFDVRALGPTVKLWQTRCILCERCVRFADKVSGTRELCVHERGDRNEIDVYPGQPLDNPIMGNVVDLCPVGALIDRNTMFKGRAFLMKETASVSPDSSAGNPIWLSTSGDQVRRIHARWIMPDARRSVPGRFWIADEERYNFQWLSDERRLRNARCDGREAPPLQAAREAARRLKAAVRGEVAAAVIVSTFATNEELFLVRRLMDALGIRSAGLLSRPAAAPVSFPGFLIEGDKNPNRRGVDLILGPQCTEAAAEGILRDAAAGRLSALLVMNGIPYAGTIPWTPPAELAAAAKAVKFMAIIDVASSGAGDAAHISIPGAAYSEKWGTWVNKDGLVQRVDRAANPPGGADEAALLQAMLAELGALIGGPERSAAAVFEELAAIEPAFSGLKHPMLNEGMMIHGA